jgi:hypothetical protein
MNHIVVALSGWDLVVAILWILFGLVVAFVLGGIAQSR